MLFRSGMPFEEMVREKVPDIGGFAYFASMPDEVLALKAHKIDGIFINNALIDFAAAHNPDLVKMTEHYLDSNFGFAFPKGDPQRDVWGAIIDRMKADGTINALWDACYGAPSDQAGGIDGARGDKPAQRRVEVQWWQQGQLGQLWMKRVQQTEGLSHQ